LRAEGNWVRAIAGSMSLAQCLPIILLGIRVLLFTSFDLLGTGLAARFGLLGLDPTSTMDNLLADRVVQLVFFGCSHTNWLPCYLSVLKLLGFATRLFGERMGHLWDYLEARFHDHRGIGVGYVAFLITVVLFMNAAAIPRFDDK
jgi:hypothetical protein